MDGSSELMGYVGDVIGIWKYEHKLTSIDYEMETLSFFEVLILWNGWAFSPLEIFALKQKK